MSYPLITAALAIGPLGEPLSPAALLGIVLVGHAANSW
jgi:drug/metabolite transporter (DMT)-like permease